MNCDISNVYNEIFRRNYCSRARHLSPDIEASPLFRHFIYRGDAERLYYERSGDGRTFSVYVFYDKNTYLIERLECSCVILERDFDDFGIYRKVFNGFLKGFSEAFDGYLTD